jgi:hypothetical protein
MAAKIAVAMALLAILGTACAAAAADSAPDAAAAVLPEDAVRNNYPSKPESKCFIKYKKCCYEYYPKYCYGHKYKYECGWYKEYKCYHDYKDIECDKKWCHYFY